MQDTSSRTHLHTNIFITLESTLHKTHSHFFLFSPAYPQPSAIPRFNQIYQFKVSSNPPHPPKEYQSNPVQRDPLRKAESSPFFRDRPTSVRNRPGQKESEHRETTAVGRTKRKITKRLHSPRVLPMERHSPPSHPRSCYEDVPVGKLVRCKVQCLVGTVCPTFLRGAINDRPGVRVT